jgi:response regulator of citrate/malate metabolism
MLQQQTSVQALLDVLVVEPDADSQAAFQSAWSSVAHVHSCSDFRTARRQLFQHPPDLLVTNVYLQEFNGLHLVHLAATAALKTRSIVYAKELDLGLAREAQAAGAFYERADRLSYILSSYTRKTLPPHDRRDPALIDRRLCSYRGGRRGPEVVVAREHANEYSAEILRDFGGDDRHF